jgi:hypothetical protein
MFDVKEQLAAAPPLAHEPQIRHRKIPRNLGLTSGRPGISRLRRSAV